MSTLNVDNLKTLSGNGIDAEIVSIGGGHLSNRNIIINGAMTVSQRATSASFTGGGNVYPALDRFKAIANSSMTVNTTISQTADSPDGLGYCLKVLVNASQTPTGSENFMIRYIGEEQDIKRFGYGTSACKQATISFSVKSNKTGLYSLQVYLGNNTPNIIVTYTINSENTWERKTITLPTYTTSYSHNADNNKGFAMDFHLSDGPDDIVSTTGWSTGSTLAKAATGQVNLLDATNNYWQMTNLQFEVGDTATSFEHRIFADELHRCKRYYQKIVDGSDDADEVLGVAHAWNSVQAEVSLRWDVEMRATPTLKQGVGTNYYRVLINSVNKYTNQWLEYRFTRRSGMLYNTNFTGLGGGNAYRVKLSNANAYLHLEAEL